MYGGCVMASRSSTWPLALALLALVWTAYGGDYDDFNLEDALGPTTTEKPKPKPPKVPGHKPGADLDLSDFFDTPSKTTTQPPRPPPKKPGDFDLSDFFDTPSKPTTKPPRPVTRPPPKKPDKPKNPGNKPAPNDLDLADALDDKNDPKGRGSKVKERDNPARDSDITDGDLEDILGGGGYSPDKKKGGYGGGGGGPGHSAEGDNSDAGGSAEPVTIAGIASGLAMALLGAVVSYISYQKKKFCFSIQQSLNAEYVKGEQAEGVVCEETPVKYSAMEYQSAIPPTEDSSKV